MSNILARSIIPARRDDNAYLRAAGLGAVTGMRSMLPLALLSAALSPDSPVGGYAPSRSDGLAARLLSSKIALVTNGLAAVGELVGDKLPMAPGRLEPPVFAERLVVGALVGGVVSQLGGRSVLVGAAIGSVTSGAAAALGYYGRTTLSRITPLPQQAWGVLEDGLALALGATALGLHLK